MTSIILDRLKSYNPRSKQEETNALKEIYQEIALAGLARSNFFKVAAFQGGTALRIIHQLKRFSEDLDFVCIRPLETFKWEAYLAAIETEFHSFGIHLNIKDRTQAEGQVKKAFLKDESFGRVLELKYDRLPSDSQVIRIKLEIDINPPDGSLFESSYLTYPYPFSILVQDLPSLFATKCHAILCRKYEKGRDWFDFLWYVARKTPINYLLLKKALFQSGPYKDLPIPFGKQWLVNELEQKMNSIGWKNAREDIENFLLPEDRKLVQGWEKELFLAQLSKIDLVLKDALIFRIAHGSPPNLDPKHFSSAITDLTDAQIVEIKESGTYWFQSTQEIEELNDDVLYECIFIRFDDPGHTKHMAYHRKKGQSIAFNAVPGEKYSLPGWFIKNWNGRRQVHTHDIPRALFWFQPLIFTPSELIAPIASFAKETDVYSQ
jgi:predicted nucleotidyltransferase component of viral defense system